MKNYSDQNHNPATIGDLIKAPLDKNKKSNNNVIETNKKYISFK